MCRHHSLWYSHFPVVLFFLILSFLIVIAVAFSRTAYILVHSSSLANFISIEEAMARANFSMSVACPVYLNFAWEKKQPRVRTWLKGCTLHISTRPMLFPARYWDGSKVIRADTLADGTKYLIHILTHTHTHTQTYYRKRIFNRGDACVRAESVVAHIQYH